MKKRVIAAVLSALMVFGSLPAVQSSAADENAGAVETLEAPDVSTGPLYWMAYESAFEKDHYLEEDRWDKNVDWMASQGFVKAGYDMMSTDGWIEGAQTIDENGYVTKYNYSWDKTWKEMAEQLKESGMTLGVYYDPLWVTAAAYNSDAKIVGTDIPVRSLVNDAYGHFSNFKEQDVPQGEGFDGKEWCKQGEPALYWLDTDKEGAEAYIKGYVKHFADAGATFLRVDFLGWYENGINGDGKQNEKPSYGTARYEAALKWMREACDENGVMLSLVMPNQYNHAEVELKYGHMMCVNEDVANGGWDSPQNGPEMGWQNNHISGRRRGQWQKDWAQWGNSFDAFTGWADVGGRGQMILDGDFLRMARFDVIKLEDNSERPIAGEEIVTADAQKRSAVSLAAMAGSPICIADQYDTLNENAPDGVDNSVYYLNEEILALNKAGFVAKPMGLGESERWAGQLPDGSWVVGLFNRDRTVKNQTLNFKEDLGITGTASVRELWQHKNYGKMDCFTVDLAACDCRILKITPDTVRYEAEVASLRDGANNNKNHSNFSGWGFADKLEKSGGDVLFAVNASGTQDIQLRYCNGSAENRPVAGVYVNEKKVGEAELPFTGSWDSWGTVTVENVEFVSGENLVDIQCMSDVGFNLDYIEIGSAGAEPEKKVHILCEAEGAEIGNGAKINTDHQLAYDKRFVDGLDHPHWYGDAATNMDTLKFYFSVEEEGDYDLNFRYANGGGDATADVFVNNQKLGYFTFPTVYQEAWDTWSVVTLYKAQEGGDGIQLETVHLNAGDNTVEYKHGTGAINMDCLIITPHKEDSIRTVDHVQSFEGIRIPAGSSFDELNLPSKAGVRLTGEDISQEVTVTWSEEDIRLDTAGTYILTGILQLGELGENISNTKAAEIAVTVEGKKITEVEEITGIETEKGVAFESLVLPETVGVTLEDGTSETLQVVWEHGSYNAQKAGRYLLNGSLKIKKGIVNPEGLNAQIIVTVQKDENEPDPEEKIVEVSKLTEIWVDNGTAFADLMLPETAEVTLEGGTKETLNVTWNAGNYDAQLAGTYTLSGNLELKEGIVNPDGLVARIKVTVKEADIPSPPVEVKIIRVGKPADILAVKGTAFAELLLPKTIEVTLEDGTSETVNVTWNVGDYNAEEIGAYTISGDLALKEGMINPDNLTAQITVKISEGDIPEPIEEAEIIAVKELEGIEVEKGTAFAELLLPKLVNVTLTGGVSDTLNVIWNADNYDAQKAGTYVLTGDLELKEGIVNSDSLVAQITVTVKEADIPNPPEEKHIIEVMELEGIQIGKGTPFETLALPKTVEVTLSGGVKETLNVTWNAAGYSAQEAGTYTLTGDLELKEGIENPDGLKAKMTVTVKDETQTVDPPKKKVIASIRSIPGMEVAFGTVFEALTLPKTVIADMEDKTTETLDITWNPGSYDAQKAGTYTLSGTIVAKSGIVNPKGLKAQVTVTVKADTSVRDGNVYTVGEYKYKVISASKKTVSAAGLKSAAKKKKLKKIIVPNTVKLHGTSYRVTAVEASAFKNCTKATSASLGKNIITIGKHAFNGCKKVKQVTVNSKKMTTIGVKAFYNCKVLTKVTIQSTALKRVGNNAFGKTAKKLIVKVPAKKRAAYKKLLKGKGLSKLAKVK